MDDKKPYIVAIVIQIIYTGMFVITKAVFDHGLNTFVYVFYCQAAACLLLLPIAVIREREKCAIHVVQVVIEAFLMRINRKYICHKFVECIAAVHISNRAVCNKQFQTCEHLLLGLAIQLMEVVKLKSAHGIAKVTGIALCLAGVFVIAFFGGPSLSPVNHHHAFHTGHSSSNAAGHVTWIKGAFLKVLGDIAWAVWIIFQAALLKEYPNKMLVTVAQCVFSTVQTLIVAMVAERDMSRWKLGLDISLIAVLYTGFLVSGAAYYLQAWCMEMKGPVFAAIWFPLCFILTIFCSSFFLGEIIHLGSILGGILLVGGLYSVLWAKSKETKIQPSIKVNATEGAEDVEEERKPEEKDGKKEHEEEASPYAIEQV
ncbi:hypothetical protein ACP4OV_014398 [Aristida adscensionis]